MGKAFTFRLRNPDGSPAHPHTPGAELLTCSYALPEDGTLTRTSSPCQALQGTVMGGSETSLWTVSASPPGFGVSGDLATSYLVRHYRREGNQLVITSSLSVPNSVGVATLGTLPLRQEEEVARWAPAWLLAREEEGEIVLERYSTENDFRAATSDAIWMSRGSQTAFVTF